jgi:hypothetical protein
MPYNTSQQATFNQAPKSYSLDFPSLKSVLGSRSSIDTTCPECSPFRSRTNVNKKIFRVWLLTERSITFNCIHCGIHGTVWKDGKELDLSREKMVEIHRQREQQRLDEEAERIYRALTIWDRAVPGMGTPAEDYFAGRGIEVPEPIWRRIRYLRKCYFGDVGGELPAVVIPMTQFDDQSKISAVQVIALNSRSGNYKFGGKSLKRTHGIVSGRSAVMTAPLGDHLCVTEGFETALAVRQLGYNEGAPIWATLGASFLMSLPVIDTVSKLTIFADNDLPDKNGKNAGLDAAKRLKGRWIRHCEVDVRWVDVPGKDYVDLLTQVKSNG